MRLLAVTMLAVAGAACSPDIPEGRFDCETASDCPTGWHCVGGLCHSRRLDAGLLDARVPDTGTLDDGGPPADSGGDAGSARDAGPTCPADMPDAGTCAMPASTGATLAPRPSAMRPIAGYGLQSADDRDTFVIVFDPAALGVLATVELGGIPMGDNYELGVAARCTGAAGTGIGCMTGDRLPVCGSADGCVSTRAGNMSEQVQVRANCGAGSDVELRIEVWATTWSGVCADYRLDVTGQSL